MRIPNHDVLTEYISRELGKLPLIADNEVRVTALGSLDKDSLADFFDYGTSVGLYIHGGEFEQEGMVELEHAAVAIVIGCRNYAGDTASLGTDDDPGAWHYLESIRNALTGMDIRGTNIHEIKSVQWRNLLVRADMAVLGLDMRITLARPLPDHDLQDIYGAGYGQGEE